MTKGIFGVFATNQEAERSGRWFTFPANEDGTIPQVKLARLSENNEAWQAALDKHGMELRREAAMDVNITEERASPVYRKAFIETILLDWQNFQDPDGNEIPFTPENADNLLTTLPEFFRVLRVEASKLANYREDAIKALAGK